MHVLLTHPHAWPRVRRGAERELHELAAGLAERGHHLRIVTGTDVGVTRRREVLGVEVRELRVPPSARLDARGWHFEARFGALAAAAWGLSRADLVQHLLYADAAFAGRFAIMTRGRPSVLKLTGMVLPERLARTPVDERLFRGALERASVVWCNSAYARDAMAPFGVPMEVVPAGIDTSRFMPGGARSEAPTVLCTSAPDEPRKRVADLVDAWPEILASRPQARLVIAGHASEATRAELGARLPSSVRASVSFVGLVDNDRLLTLLRTAWVVVQPSVHEALGLSVLEALACGTPVVGADSGATPELIGADRVFAPLSPAACAAAVAAQLTRAPAVDEPATLRASTSAFSWTKVLSDVEARHRALVEARS